MPNPLSLTEAYDLQKSILENELSDAEMLEVFSMLDRPLEDEEFYGLYKASAEAMVKVDTKVELLDTCGTGGDGLDTFNISTAAALVCAALGVPVAKHGNRSSSSRCGSADVLEALGVKINLDATQVAKSIEATGFGFMFAQKFHPAFKHASSARKAYGKRTYFNFLGPLLNPGQAAYRLVGVADPSMAELMGKTLLKSGVTKAWVVHSQEGMDEISISSKSSVLEFIHNREVREQTIDPTEYGFSFAPLMELLGGNAAYNASIVRNVLNNQGSTAQTNAVVLNAAAGLVVTGKVQKYSDAITIAVQAIQERVAIKKLNQIVMYTNQL